MRNERMVIPKKGIRVCNNLSNIGIDFAVNKILNSLQNHIPFGVTISNVLAYNPSDVIITILALKLGFTNKIVLSIILAFVL